MERVLTENQTLLTRYLGAVGCELVAVMLMIVELWDERATIEMLEYCRDHPDARQAELLKASSEISSKYPRDDEEE